jgi:hypothetical protein
LPPWRTDDTFEKGEEDADDVNFVVGTDPFGLFTCARKNQPSLEDPIKQVEGFDANQGYTILKQHHLRSALQFKASTKTVPTAKLKPKRNEASDSGDEEDEEEELNDFPLDLAWALCAIQNTGGDDTLFVGPWIDEHDVSGVLVTLHGERDSIPFQKKHVHGRQTKISLDHIGSKDSVPHRKIGCPCRYNV